MLFVLKKEYTLPNKNQMFYTYDENQNIMYTNYHLKHRLQKAYCEEDDKFTESSIMIDDSESIMIDDSENEVVSIYNK